jgi:hypothetical protein
LPKLTVSICASPAPSSVIMRLTRIGALLAERDVVFARAALVGVALDRHARSAILLQIARVRFDQRAVFVLDDEAVEVEVDAALRQDVVRVAQRIAAPAARPSRSRRPPWRRRFAHRPSGAACARRRAAVVDRRFRRGRTRATGECRRDQCDPK